MTKADIHESVLQIGGDSKRPDHYDPFCKLIAVIAAGAPVGVFAVWLRLRLRDLWQKFFGGGAKWVGRKLE